MIEKIFHLKENETTVSKECIAGLTTFFAMAYIIFVIPSILSGTGMDYYAVYTATIIASIVGTLIMGLYANVPYAQASGLALASLFAYTICGSLGYTWQQALAMIFICGVINVIVTITSLRKRIIKAIPTFMQDAITVGIGLFISYIGFTNAQIIEFGASGVKDGIANDVVPRISSFTTASVVLALIGLLITIVLLVKKVKGAYLLSILLTTIIGIPMGVTSLPDFSGGIHLPSIAPTFLQMDFQGIFTAGSGLLVVLMTIFTLAVSDLFDTIGVFIGTGKKSGIFRLDENGNMPKKLERALIADSISTVLASVLGTSNITTYIESSAGIEAGGRTGLTSVIVAFLFFLSLFFAPIIQCVPMAAVAPVLIMIGLSMLANIAKIDLKDYVIAIPAFFIIILMPLSYSITTGIEFGFITYAITSLLSKEKRNVSPIIFFFAIFFIVKYVYQAIG